MHLKGDQLFRVACPVCDATGSHDWDPIVPEDSPSCWLCHGAGMVSPHRIPWQLKINALGVMCAVSGVVPVLN